MQSPPIQYAKTNDGVRIAYWTMGRPGLPLVMSPPLGWSHISMEHRFPDLLSWYTRLAGGRPLVRYDERCQGLSDRGVEDVSEAAFARDVEAVLHRLEFDHVDLMAMAGATPSFIFLAASRPELVRKLVLWNPYLRGRDELDHPRTLAIRSLIERDWEVFTETLGGSAAGWGTREGHAFASFVRSSSTPEDAIRMYSAVSQFDSTPLLERIRAPTLVLNTPGALRSPDGPRDMVAGLPDARLAELSSPEPVFRNEEGTRAVEAFLSEGERPYRTSLPSGTAVILFADIAGSTALTERLGDAAFRERARRLDGELRAAIHTNGGQAIEGKLLGDGVLATFGAAREAIACAQACHAAAGGVDLTLHVGVHAGDIISEEGNVFGGAVNIAARISDASAPGETLVSDVVRALARTSAGVAFEDRGERALKGIEEPLRVWAVRPGE